MIGPRRFHGHPLDGAELPQPPERLGDAGCGVGDLLDAHLLGLDQRHIQARFADINADIDHHDPPVRADDLAQWGAASSRRAPALYMRSWRTWTLSGEPRRLLATRSTLRAW